MIWRFSPGWGVAFQGPFIPNNYPGYGAVEGVIIEQFKGRKISNDTFVYDYFRYTDPHDASDAAVINSIIYQ